MFYPEISMKKNLLLILNKSFGKDVEYTVRQAVKMIGFFIS